MISFSVHPSSHCQEKPAVGLQQGSREIIGLGMYNYLCNTAAEDLRSNSEKIKCNSWIDWVKYFSQG